jgi:hypothetical protein
VSTLLNALHWSALPDGAEALRQEVKQFLIEELPPAPAAVRCRSWVGFDAAFSRKLAARGWVGATLPRVYGGSDVTAFHRYVLVEELLAAGAPVGAHWVADRQSGPLLLKYGSSAQKDFYLPRICRGEAFFCIGMSEPDSGSDLASVGTRATRESGGWRLNGNKIWVTNAHRCHFSIVLARTSGTSSDRHHGLSQVIVDLSLPGVHLKPIVDLNGDDHFCEIFFDSVLLPLDALVGEEGAGWPQVTAELAFERSGPERIYSSIVLLNCWIAWLRRIGEADAYVEQIGRFTAHLATLRQLCIAVTAKLVAGESPAIEAALVKELGTTFEQSIPAYIEAAVRANPEITVDDELLRAVEYTSHIAPTFSLRGGTREILRGMISRGLGLR